jgi:DNA-binding transcriptional ArsR family regulator
LNKTFLHKHSICYQMRMVREIWHPKAYLSIIKNIKLGLRARTRILNVLEKRSIDARAIANEAGMHYRVVVHHLKLLEAEEIVERKGSRPNTWMLTGIGQKRLLNTS